MAPGTLWRRALKRVERRNAAYQASMFVGNYSRHEAHDLLCEAVRLANRLAYCAGIAGPLAR